MGHVVFEMWWSSNVNLCLMLMFQRVFNFLICGFDFVNSHYTKHCFLICYVLLIDKKNGYEQGKLCVLDNN
jgi:hypothetical protein